MRLFLRDHIPLIFFTIAQLFLVLLIYWLDGYRHLSTALYSVFLGVCLLIGYLLYRYFSYRSFYMRLSAPPKNLDEFTEKTGFAPLATALDELLKTQYLLCQNQLKTWERKNSEHLTFMNQWVHQMKTPLSVIELITQDEDDLRFESIAEETDRMRKGLEMVLYVARLGVFEHDFRVERIQLHEVVHNVIHENKKLFIRNQVYPEISIDPALTVESDAKWLRFILNQLLSNAIKYSAGSRENVTVNAYPKNRAVILEVKDRGIGIPKADLSRVFRPFYTGENGRRFKESTGMGLYLIHEVCEKLNHKIELESEINKGTIARIIFPYSNH
ncbi:sensor histidine kinase [Aneurinibacillus migulanus]|uniref:sensor histidine kinase n=1 Tax=Aneurinibacillus migulanus TaxID=47500 RepID=UPI002E211438|nr:sensor histidine kinase [Aneurinibacillus migulanus]